MQARRVRREPGVGPGRHGRPIRTARRPGVPPARRSHAVLARSTARTRELPRPSASVHDRRGAVLGLGSERREHLAHGSIVTATDAGNDSRGAPSRPRHASSPGSVAASSAAVGVESADASDARRSSRMRHPWTARRSSRSRRAWSAARRRPRARRASTRRTTPRPRWPRVPPRARRGRRSRSPRRRRSRCPRRCARRRSSLSGRHRFVVHAARHAREAGDELGETQGPALGLNTRTSRPSASSTSRRTANCASP